MNKSTKSLVTTAVCALGMSMFSVSALAACTDPWVTSAVKQVTGRDAQGSGNSGQCNINLYGGGHWSNYNDLVSKVKAALQPSPVATAAKPPAPVLLNQNKAPGLVGANGIVASGGGNIVASGGGNIVASGGGNLNKGATPESSKIISTNGGGLKKN